MKFFLIPLCFFCCLSFSYATHNKAGEVTYKHVSGLTYEITVTTYTDSSAPADRPKVEIKWGDGSSDTVSRFNGPDNDGDGIPDGEYIGNSTKKNFYIAQHTYPGPSTYVISFEDANRVTGVTNIPNSVNIPFYVQTILLINNVVGENNSPVLLYPPIDNGCVGKIFIHNPPIKNIPNKNYNARRKFKSSYRWKSGSANFFKQTLSGVCAVSLVLQALSACLAFS